MPARIRKIRHDEDTRTRIKVGNIINRLQKHVDGDIEMSATQLRAAEILLRKTLPDLTSVEHSGEVTTSYVMQMPPVAESTEEWLKTTSKLSGVPSQDHKAH